MALENVVGEAPLQEHLKQFLLVLSVSLAVATLSRSFPRFRDIPYTLLLVIVGLILALLDVRLINVPPEVTLFIFLPPLLLKTALDLNWSLVKHDINIVFLCAVIGVFLTITGVTITLTSFTNISPLIALLAGASLSATAPAPITALFGRLGVNQRLVALTDGENLFNVAIAIGVFVLLMDLPTDLDFTQVDLIALLKNVGTLAGIGLIMGGIIGLIFSYLIHRSDLRFLGRSLLLVASYGTYLFTEELGGSGVVAVIVTGLILGTFGVSEMNPHKKQVLSEFLAFVAFLVNSIVFLLIGDKINFSNLGANIYPIGIAIVTVVAMRAIAIYGTSYFGNKFEYSNISFAEQTVLWWSGLRGSISIALALSVPIVLVQSQTLEAVVFGVVLFTLLVQGLSSKWLLKQLGFLYEEHLQEKYLELIARTVALKQILTHLNEEEMTQRWEVDPRFYKYRDCVQEELKRLEQEIEDYAKKNPSLKKVANEQLKRELIAMETGIYSAFVQSGFLSDPPPLLLPDVLQDQN
ncbi:MAG: sodium:proton antiporter [Cyanobacteria bacterium]|nr:sodium:proton antiporter [Cyanobacteria bacterium GSL.Bin1]